MILTMNVDDHASDGDLVALLDGEPLVRADVETHVDSCAACSARLARLQQRSTRFRDLVSTIEVPPAERARRLADLQTIARPTEPTARRSIWSRPGMRAAAAILLLAGLAMASPARGWILERVIGRHTEVATQPRVKLTPRSGGAIEQRPASIVRFPSESKELLITFDVRPAGGTLTIVAGQENRASAQIVARSRGEAFLLLPGELRVRNTPESAAEYEVTVGPTVERVRVQVGDTERREIANVVVAFGMRHLVSLTDPRGSR